MNLKTSLRVRKKSNYAGITLLELMIVLAITGILISIAYPLYQSQSRKKNRTIAIASLLQARAQLEKCALNNTLSYYDGCETLVDNSIDKSKLVEIIVTLKPEVNATAYKLTAKKLNAGTETDCISISIDSLGVKTSDGTGSLQRCWAQ